MDRDVVTRRMSSSGLPESSRVAGRREAGGVPRGGPPHPEAGAQRRARQQGGPRRDQSRRHRSFLVAAAIANGPAPAPAGDECYVATTCVLLTTIHP
jgi:hypothetical protein